MATSPPELPRPGDDQLDIDTGSAQPAHQRQSAELVTVA